MHELSQQSDTVVESKPQTAVSTLADFGRSIAYAGVIEPINGAIQLAAKLGGVDVGQWTFLRPENANGWAAKIGGAIGMAADFWAINKLSGTQTLLSSFKGVAQPTALTAIGRAAIVGSLYQGIAIPVEDSHGSLAVFAGQRARNAITGGITFATLAGTSRLLPLLPGLGKVAGENTIVSRGLLGALSGVPAGVASAEANSLLLDHRLTTDIGSAVRDFAVIGGVLGALPQSAAQLERPTVEQRLSTTEPAGDATLYSDASRLMLVDAIPHIEYDGEKLTNEDQLVLLKALEKLPKRGGGLLAVGPFQGLDMAVTLQSDSVVLADMNSIVAQNNRAILEIIKNSEKVSQVMPKIYEYFQTSHQPEMCDQLKRMLDATHHFGSRYKLGWATNKTDFRFIKDLIAKGKIAVAHADISDPQTTEVIGKFFAKNNVKMEYAYLSNANDPNHLGGLTPYPELQEAYGGVIRALQTAGATDQTIIIRSDSSTNAQLVREGWAKNFPSMDADYIEQRAQRSKLERAVRYGDDIQILPDLIPRVPDRGYTWEFFVQNLKAYRDHVYQTFPSAITPGRTFATKY